MKHIYKIGRLLKSAIIKTAKAIESHATLIAVVFSMLAVVVALYNTFQIKSQLNSGLYSATTGTIVTPPEKILEQMPSNAPVLGNPKAKLTVVEFGDYQCPFCERFYKENFPALKSKYIDTGKVKFVFLDFAILGQESIDAAQAANCAKDQGKFWEYHNELYDKQGQENSGTFNADNLKQFAANIQIGNLDAFAQCLTSNKYKDLIDQEHQLAKKFGVTGTPTILVGKTSYRGVGSQAQLEQMIDSQLK